MHGVEYIQYWVPIVAYTCGTMLYGRYVWYQGGGTGLRVLSTGLGGSGGCGIGQRESVWCAKNPGMPGACHAGRGSRRGGRARGRVVGEHRVLTGSLPRDASRHSPISSNQEGRTGPQQGRSKQHQRHPAPPLGELTVNLCLSLKSPVPVIEFL